MKRGTLASGQMLSRLRTAAKLSEDGMGEVYQAEGTKLGREVAIKVEEGGGGEGIRTLGRREPTPVFKTGAFNSCQRKSLSSVHQSSRTCYRLTNGPRVTLATVPKLCHSHSR